MAAALPLPTRPYGPSAAPLSVVGFGGIVVADMPLDDAKQIVAEAVEQGVNYFDIAPSYGDAQNQLGPALEPFRKDCFLACKTTQRKADAAREEFEQSLETLRTDYFDLYQLHALTEVEKDVDAAFAADGIMPMLIEAKAQGRVQHIGFSAHSAEAALEALARYPFDSVLFPISFATYFAGKFEPRVIDYAAQHGLTLLALKSMAMQRWADGDPDKKKYPHCWYQPITDRRWVELAMRFTLGQPQVTAMLPPGDASLFRLALEVATTTDVTAPLSADELAELEAKAESINPIFAAP